MEKLIVQATTGNSSSTQHPEAYFDQFAHYEHPQLARDIFHAYQEEQVIPEKKLKAALNTCTTINQLRARLGELEIRFTKQLIVTETSTEYHRLAEEGTRQSIVESAMGLLMR